MVEDPPVPRNPKRMVVIALGLLVAVNLGIVAVRSTKTDETTVALPRAIVRTYPKCGGINVAQQAIGAALLSGYRGELALDGTPLPLDEYVDFAAASGTVLWQPGPGKAFERIAPGNHVLSITYAPIDRAAGQRGGSFSCNFKVG